MGNIEEVIQIIKKIYYIIVTLFSLYCNNKWALELQAIITGGRTNYIKKPDINKIRLNLKFRSKYIKIKIYNFILTLNSFRIHKKKYTLSFLRQYFLERYLLNIMNLKKCNYDFKNCNYVFLFCNYKFWCLLLSLHSCYKTYFF